MALTKSIESLIEKKLTKLGIELIELKYVSAGSRSMLKIFIEKEGGVTAADCGKASNEISLLLDVENFSKMPYTLEVSSPGIDRPLLQEKDYKRVVGKNISLLLKNADSQNAVKTGILISCSDGNLCIETKKGPEVISIANINSGKIEVMFK